MHASDFYHIDLDDNDATCGELDIGSERTAFAWMEAYAALRVREELEAACNSMCPFCAKYPMHEAYTDHHNDGGKLWLCKAMVLRKRISELAGSEEGSR